MQYILTVSEINKYIAGIISRDLVLSNLWVKGEISNFKYHYSGHLYFTLKDENCLLKCVMFKRYASALRFQPENGMNVIIKGYISVFERDGQYQLYVEEMQPDGLGSLYIAFEQLKSKLQKEGLFDKEHKKKIPLLPDSIGVITSTTGAVIRDIINVLNRRFSNAAVKIYPAAVQGELASAQIAWAIRRINELDCVDVIIIARGGGSLEELWAFNEEVVARAIYDSHIPIISAVGHETDYTICDFAADLRAPTPSAAAELVLPEKQVMKNTIQALENSLKSALNKKVSLDRTRYEKLSGSIVFKQPYNKIFQERMRLEAQTKRLEMVFDRKRQAAGASLSTLAGKLDALSPLTVLARGYSVVKLREKNVIVKSVEDVQSGDKVEAVIKDGRIHCVVEGIERGKTGGQERKNEL